MTTLELAINQNDFMFLVRLTTLTVVLAIVFFLIYLLCEDMSDEFDMASDIEQQHRDSAINAIRKKKPVAQATGLCLCCMIPVDNGRRWCCAECRDQWSKENER